MTKRNAPCDCGSGKKFKHCHGKFSTGSNDPLGTIEQRRREALLRQRRTQQGFGKPIQFHQMKDKIAVVIGRALMLGAWRTFTDFLLDYFAARMGREWIATEMSKGNDGHPIGQWATAMRDAQPKATGVIKSTINNGFRSILSAAYNLYLIEHHYEQYDEPLFERILNRLRRPDDFLSTLAETNAAASFLKAGFLLEYEDDRRAGHHSEFIASHPKTKNRFSVEVATRSGKDRSELKLKDRIKLKNKLSHALKKSLPWTRVVFVDLNIPDVLSNTNDVMLDELLIEVEEAERSLRIKGSPAPSAYLFLTNQPFHYNLQSMEGAPLIGALGFKLPTFQPRGSTTFREVILGRELHPEMHDLIESMKLHGEPPSTFDGEHPEFVFSENPFPRWIVGNEYLVPGPNDTEVLAQLKSASAHAETGRMHGIFQFEGVNFVVDSPMTEIEIAVYKRNPETFFGVVQNVGQRANNAGELADFFYENYKDTPKETLLEFLKQHPLIDRLRTLSQRDLAIFICEQWALAADQKNNNGSA